MFYRFYYIYNIVLAVTKDPRLITQLPEDDPYIYDELEAEFLGPKPPKFRVIVSLKSMKGIK